MNFLIQNFLHWPYFQDSFQMTFPDLSEKMSGRRLRINWYGSMDNDGINWFNTNLRDVKQSASNNGYSYDPENFGLYLHLTKI